MNTRYTQYTLQQLLGVITLDSKIVLESAYDYSIRSRIIKGDELKALVNNATENIIVDCIRQGKVKSTPVIVITVYLSELRHI